MLYFPPDRVCPVMPVLPEPGYLSVQHSSLPVRSPGFSAAAGDPNACRAGPLLFPLLFQLQPLSLTRQAQEYLKSSRCCCCTGLAALALWLVGQCTERCMAFIPTRANVYLTTKGLSGARVNNQPITSIIITTGSLLLCRGPAAPLSHTLVISPACRSFPCFPPPPALLNPSPTLVLYEQFHHCITKSVYAPRYSSTALKFARQLKELS